MNYMIQGGSERKGLNDKRRQVEEREEMTHGSSEGLGLNDKQWQRRYETT